MLIIRMHKNIKFNKSRKLTTMCQQVTFEAMYNTFIIKVRTTDKFLIIHINYYFCILNILY